MTNSCEQLSCRLKDMAIEVDNPLSYMNEEIKTLLKQIPFFKKLLGLSPSLSNFLAMIMLIICPTMIDWIAVIHIVIIAVIIPIWFFAQVPYSGINMIKDVAITLLQQKFPTQYVSEVHNVLIRSTVKEAFQSGISSFSIQMAMASIFCVVIYGAHAMEYFLNVSKLISDSILSIWV